jgi:hypothetical protein
MQFSLLRDKDTKDGQAIKIMTRYLLKTIKVSSTCCGIYNLSTLIKLTKCQRACQIIKMTISCFLSNFKWNNWNAKIWNICSIIIPSCFEDFGPQSLN